MGKLLSDFSMVLPEDDAIGPGIRSGFYEHFEVEAICNVVGEGDVFVDVGANIGIYTLLASGLVGHTGKVYAIEPEPFCFSMLKENVRRNEADNVELLMTAVGEKEEERSLYQSTTNAGDHAFYQDENRTGVISIRVKKLDDLIHDKVRFLKIDVQGAEHEVLLGARKLLARQKGMYMMVEYWPYGLKSAGRTEKEFVDFLFTLGFNLFCFAPNLYVSDDEGAVTGVDFSKSYKMVYMKDSESIVSLYPPGANKSLNLWCVK